MARGKKMSEITEQEQLLQNKATMLKIRIKTDAELLEEVLIEIKKLHKKRCPHTDATVDENGYKVYCYECDNNL